MNSSKRISAICLGVLWLASMAWPQVVVPKKTAPPPQGKAPATAKAAPAKSSVAAKGKATHERPAKSGKPHAGAGRPTPELSEGTRPRVVHRVRRPTRPPRTVESKNVAGHGKRDPFVSPIVERGKVHVACTGTGRQCLEVGDLTLQGVVKGPSGFIAVVVNGEHTYFLRERDPLANGDVELITQDSIHLRERYQDDLGRTQTRQVVRKVVVPAV